MTSLPDKVELPLFVYGTLRRGGVRADLLVGSDYLGEAVATGELRDLGSFPALVLRGAAPVHGELWSCPLETLARLDAYEGVDEGIFERVRLTVEGTICWTYVAGPALAREVEGAPRIEGGCWRPAGIRSTRRDDVSAG